MDPTEVPARLQEIIFAFPDNTRQERVWNRTFGRLLAGIPGQKGLRFEPEPHGALPVTAFRTTASAFPSIRLLTDVPIEAITGKLLISSQSEPIESPGTLEANGELEEAETAASEGMLPIEALYSRLQGHLVAIDHTGVNLPVQSIEPSKWEGLIQSLAAITNLYRYPGEAWPFIIPATEAEFYQDITNFTPVRIPKFEWVFDAYTALPLFQFALVTDLSRQELEEAFPAPYGFAIPGLDSIFRSVRLDSPWKDGLEIRIDLYYRRNEGAPTDWETGKWLITDGGRIPPLSSL